MKNTLLVLGVIITMTILNFGQDSGRDLNQTPTSFENPEIVYGSPLNSLLSTLSESFEDPTFPPAGWLKLSPDGGTGWERLTAGTTPFPGWNGGTVTVPPGGGSAVAFATWTTGGATSNDQWIVTPQITNVQTGDELSFWMWFPFSSYADQVDLLISTTGTAPADFNVAVDQFILTVGSADTSWTQYTYTLTNHVAAGSNIYIAWREHVADNYNDGAIVCVDLIDVTSGSPGTITIAEAIEDLNMDYVPDMLGQTVTVEGVVFSPNYQTTNNDFFIDDGTAGTDIFMYGPPVFTWNSGDMLQITGVVSQYNGKTEIIPVDSSGWVFQSAGNPTPNPIVITLAQYKANPELYEGSLVGFVSLTKISGTWPAAGTSVNLSFSDGMDTVVFRIDSDTDIDGQPEPSWPSDIIGIGSQFDSSTPPDGGYQIFPRYYTLDFLPAGSLPVELSSFSASVNQGNVTLHWLTATETNNYGFEIQRSNDAEFFTIGFVLGNGTTTETHDYSYVDRNLNSGSYSYRLKQMDYSGVFSYSSVVNVDVTAPVAFELLQNYPNPFNPSTTIKFTIPQSSVVTLKVFNTLGQEVKTLINQNMESGAHSISFDATDLNSGVYFYKLDAGQFSDVRKMTLIK